jgi:hypothetical protein
VEEEEAADEHGECYGAEGEDEVSPAHVVFLTALAGRGGRWAGEIWDESPSEKRSDQVTDWPENGQ